MLSAQELNGELAAALFVSVSVGAVLRAATVAGRAHCGLLGWMAGACAASAVLIKQNFVDGFAFAAVLLVVGSATSTNRLRYRPAAVIAAAAGFVLGAAAPVAATAVWAITHHRLGQLLYAMFGFRADAEQVMARWSWNAPLHRLETLLVAATVSGMLLLLTHLASTHGARLRRPDPLPWAITVTAAVEVAGVAAGENYWPHYLIGLIPMLALSAGLAARRPRPGWRSSRRLVVTSALITAVVSPVSEGVLAAAPGEAATTGHWLAASAAPGDTLVVPFTHANVIAAAHLRPGYPYSWSLPVRTLDPHLTLLSRTLTGASAPSWVVEWDGDDEWGLDPLHRVQAALRAHYRVVADVCGHPVWLRQGLPRRLAPTPATSACRPEGAVGP
jgi:hypothetical protein